MATDSLPLHMVRLTPPGRGAVATILIEGAGAAELTGSLVCFKPDGSPANFSVDRLTLARFAHEKGEEIIVRARSANAVEMHCHGGYAAAAGIEDVLKQLGCRSVDWKQWIVEKHLDPIAGEAIAALAEAPTRRTASILLDQYNGALRREFDAIEQCVRTKEFDTARDMAKLLLKRQALGLHLRDAWQVVVAGAPNAGKSCLINALLGFKRSIVHPQPGTTRDAVTTLTAIDGWPVELCDTAGLHPDAQGIEKAGVELARQRIEDADLVLFVVDITATQRSEQLAMAHTVSNSLLVHNKLDLAPGDEDHSEGIFISALTGTRMESLVKKISERLVPHYPAPGAAIPFTSRQIEHLENLVRSLSL